MISHQYKFRVVYSDTDQMGYVHHSNYAKYYETARWELFRSLDISYKVIEDSGFLLPVTSLSVKFIKPAFYDQLLTVNTTLKAVRGARMIFSYEIVNEKDELINHGETTLAFIRKDTRKPCHPPLLVLKALEDGNLI